MSSPDPDPPAPIERPPSGALVLAAAARAELHRVEARGGARARARDAIPGASLPSIAAHLGLSVRSASARELRAVLARLVREGSLARGRRHGAEVWTLTAAGRERLRRAGARLPARLPESPQHRTWRAARVLAARELGRFAAELRVDLEAAEAMLQAGQTPHSDAWLELGERLRVGARRVGSALHCLHEWPEPDDGRADVDERREPGDAAVEEGRRRRLQARRSGRRNVRLWRDPR